MEPNESNNDSRKDSSTNGGLPPVAPTPAKRPRTKLQERQQDAATETAATAATDANASASAIVNEAVSTPTQTPAPYISPPGVRTRSGRKLMTPKRLTATTSVSASTSSTADTITTTSVSASASASTASNITTTAPNAKSTLKRRREDDDDGDDNGNANGSSYGTAVKKAKTTTNALDSTTPAVAEVTEAIVPAVGNDMVLKEDQHKSVKEDGNDKENLNRDIDVADVTMEEKEDVTVAATTTTTEPANDASVKAAVHRPSITNINLKLPSQKTPAKAAAAAATAASVSITGTDTGTVAGIDESNLPTNKNIRVRNIFTPAVKRTRRPPSASPEHQQQQSEKLKTLSPPVTFQLNNDSNGKSNNTSDESEIEKPRPSSIEHEQLQAQAQLGVIPGAGAGTGARAAAAGGRENGLFHYYFKRAVDRLTPIPVQFNNGRNDMEGVLRPEPQRIGAVSAQSGIPAVRTGVDGGVGAGIGNEGETIANGNENVNVSDRILHNEQNEVDEVEEEEEGDEIDGDQYDSNDGTGTSPSLFHRVYVWILFIHIFCALISVGGDSDRSDLSKLLLAPFMVIPNAASYQFNYFYKFRVDEPEVEILDEVLTGSANITETAAVCEMVVDVVEEEEEEELEQPDPEPITKIEEEIVEEIVFVDNTELEEKERLLIRQRKKIQQFREEQEYMKEEEEYLKRQDEYLEEQEETIQRLLSGLQEQWLSYKNGRTQVEDLKNQLISFGRSLDTSADLLLETEDLLLQSKDTLNGINNADPDGMDLSSLIQEFSSTVKTLYRSSLLDINLGDLDLFPFSSSISIPGEGCKGKRHIFLKPNTTVTKDKKTTKKKSKKKMKDLPLVNRDEVHEAKAKLLNETDVLVREITKSSKLTKVAIDWFTGATEEEIDSIVERLPKSDSIEIASTDNLVPEKVESPGMSSNDVQVIIDGLLEVEMADSTGKFDYASVGNGAKVIRSGTRKTSPSLVENLPFINRFLSRASIKFYGHGAEAALLPTFPKTALGQCWSFEEEGARKQLIVKEMIDEHELELIEMDPDRGEYATLSVSLPKPIHVNSIVIEHPSKILSPSSQGSAIRKFRLIGFMDKEARGNPWLLGSFEYQIDDDEQGSLQQFKVKSTDETGMPIPKLSSISLSIDSNWGSEHTCLYRFRVQGNES